MQVQRDPVPASLLDDRAGVDGVEVAEAAAPALRPDRRRPTARSSTTQGAPTLGVSWPATQPLSGLTIKEGAPPIGHRPGRHRQGDGRPRGHQAVGDQIKVITDTGTYPVTVTALVGLGDTDGFAGATLAAFDSDDGRHGPRRQRHLRRDRHQGRPGRRPGDRAPEASRRCCPQRHRGRDRETSSSRRARQASTRSSAPSAPVCSCSPSSRRSSAPSSSTTCSRSRSASGSASWR